MPGVELLHANTADGDRLLSAGGRVMVATATAPSLAKPPRAHTSRGPDRLRGQELPPRHRRGRPQPNRYSARCSPAVRIRATSLEEGAVLVFHPEC